MTIFSTSKGNIHMKQIIHGWYILLEKIDNFLEETSSYGNPWDFNAEFQERVRERSSGQGHHDGISAFRRYKRTTPFVLGLNVRMGKNHWLT